MSIDDIIQDKALIASIELFRNVPLEPLEPYLRQCSERHIEPGEVLLAPDSDNRYIYIVLSGYLSVRLSAVDGPELTTVRQGECAGELSLLDNEQPTAYVIAAVAAHLLILSDNVVWSLIEASHGVARNMLYILCHRMRHSTNAIINSDRNARIDSLTGLPNRRSLDEILPRQQQRCAEGRQPLCLIMADIDNFKQLNDCYGHLAGDRTLRAVADILRENIRPSDTVARFGGEEFAIVLPDTQLETALLIAERIRNAVSTATPDQIEQKTQPSIIVNISLGVAQMRAGEPLDTLVNDADAALYRAKREGRNRVCH